jgi:hypothetical protein
MGADLVCDLQVAEQLAIIEQRSEFLEKFESRRAVDIGKTSGSGPILTSTCPGWICYAEKTHGSWILPFISRNDISLCFVLLTMEFYCESFARAKFRSCENSLPVFIIFLFVWHGLFCSIQSANLVTRYIVQHVKIIMGTGT